MTVCICICSGTWLFECQHGAKECVGNLIESCAIHFYPKTEQWWPFFLCLESSKDAANPDIGQQCAQNATLDWDKILDCANGPLGNKIEHDNGVKTNSVQPAINWVPWVTVNGQPLGDDTTTLIATVCKAYKGSNVPSACQQYRNDANKPTDDQLVHVEFYSESYCPDCIQFTLTTLKQAVDTIGDIMFLEEVSNSISNKS